MKFIASVLRGFDEAAQRAAVLARLLLWPLLYSCAVGSAVWVGRHEKQAVRLAANKLPFAERSEIGLWIVVTFAGLLALYGMAVVVRRLRRKRWEALCEIGDLNRVLVGVLATPFVLWAATEGVEKKQPIWTMLVLGAAAALFAATVYHWPVGRPADERGDPRRTLWLRAQPWLAALAVAGLWAFYGYMLTKLSVNNHHALNTRTTDLGYYDNIFYQSIHGRPLGCSFIKGGSHISAHFDPILVLLSPLYLLYPRAELLLLLQSVWLGAGVVPLYLIAKRTLMSRSAGLVLGAAYVVYPALHGANMYEFHSLTLIPPLILWLIHFFQVGAFKRYALVLVLLLLCREDVPLLLCVVGAYGVISGQGKQVRAGWLTILVCLVYYVTVRKYVMPASGLMNAGSKEAYSYEYYFKEMLPHRKGALGLLLTLTTNPMFVLEKIFGNEKKLLYLLQLFLPLGLLPFVVRRGRLMLVYGLLVTMLASRTPVFRIHFQYSCLLFPLAFALMPQGIERASNERWRASLGLDPMRMRRALLGFVLAASMLTSWKFGAFTENKAFKGGFGAIARSLSPGTAARYDKVREMVDMIEPGASVTVTNRVGPHVSNRKKVYFYRQKKQTHYVFADERELRKGALKWHKQRLKSGELVELKRYRSFILWRVDAAKIAETKKLKDAAKKKAKAKKAAEKKKKEKLKKAKAKKAAQEKIRAEEKKRAQDRKKARDKNARPKPIQRAAPKRLER